MVTDAPATPAPSHWFTLDWVELITEVDNAAPIGDDGELPLRQRHLHYARRVGATSLGAAQRMRTWHLEHDSWIPAEAMRDFAYGPNVSEIYDRNNGRAR